MMSFNHLHPSAWLLCFSVIWCQCETTRLYGHRMCKEECTDTIGCSYYQYEPHHLSCRTLIDSSKTPREDKTFFYQLYQETRSSRHVGGKVCETGSRIIVSRGMIRICVRKPRRRPPKMSQLLAVPFLVRSKERAVRIHISTGTVYPYPALPWTSITDMIYLQSTKKLIFASINRPRIISTAINETTYTVLHKSKAVKLTSDEERGFIFAVDAKLSRMLMDGGGYVKSRPSIMWFVKVKLVDSLAVDPVHAVVFIAAHTALLSSNYELQEFQVVDRGSLFTYVTADSLGHNIYYTRNQDIIIKRSFKASVSKTFGSLKGKEEWRFKLYMILFKNEEHTSQIWNNNSLIRMLTDKLPKHPPSRWLFCQIP